MVKMRENRLAGAVVLVIIAMTIYCIKYVSQSSHNGHGILPYDASDPNLLIVELAGDTDRRGIFVLQRDSTVTDLLQTSGIKTGQYCEEDLKTVLRHGDTIIIDSSQGHRSKICYDMITSSKRYVLDMAMDLNSTAADDLELVPGIGKRCANDIIEMRKKIGRFCSVDELQKIPALRGKKYQGIKRYFFIRHSV